MNFHTTFVMAALVAAIHFPEADGPYSWVAGTSPAMTNNGKK
jgi:hypothetical protein